jgi:hypothetical protein
MSATRALAPAPEEPEGATNQAGGPVEEATPPDAEPITATAEAPPDDPGNPPGQDEALAVRAGQLRAAATARVRNSAALPPVLRDRLASVVESAVDGPTDGRPLVPLEDCLRAIEDSLPDFLRQSHATAARPPHPSGEAFFSGRGEELSDARAEVIAREQLERSGLLRGQRVRVAD